jgi:predicted transcriptional regulator
MSTTIRDQFSHEVELFLATRGMAPTDFGVHAVNNPSFVQRLREGMDFRVSTIDRVRKFMMEHAQQQQNSAA